MSLEINLCNSEATWGNFNYKKIMASEVSRAAALAAALERFFMASILEVSTAPIGASSLSWLWGRHVILIWCSAWGWLATLHVLTNLQTNSSKTKQNYRSSTTSLRSFFCVFSCPFSPVSPVSTQYSVSPPYLQFLLEVGCQKNFQELTL